MEYQIVWSNTAESDFDEIIAQISNKRNSEQAISFVQLVYKKLDLLAVMPFIGVQSQVITSIRRIVISKNYSLLYQVEKDTIHRNTPFR
jgi:plasmid stabilization system protein ParE